MTRHRLQCGFTLVEIMISVAIGLFLTAGMVQMFVANKQTYRFNESLARMQENGRLALEVMGSDVRAADFWGCAERGSIANRLNTGGFDPVGISGTEGASGASDTIIVSGARGAGLRVVSNVPATSAIVVDEPRIADNTCSPSYRVGQLCNGDVALVSDCENADIFQVTDVGDTSGNANLAHQASTAATPPAGTVGNSTDALSKTYGSSASVFPIRGIEYDIAVSNGQPSLRIRENGGTWRPIAEGVQSMQITFGRDTDDNGAADEYSPAQATAGWFDDVVTVRVSLLLRSTEDGLTDSPQAVPFNGGTFNAPDRHLYQVMTGTFTVRNRIR